MRATTTLGYGSFFGKPVCQRQVAGFCFSALSPELPPCQVERHSHDHAHFVLVTAGSYISEAQHAPDLAEAPFLVYNPPGTTHRDRFQALGGRFLTLSVEGERLQMISSQIPLIDHAIAVSGPSARWLALKLAREVTHWRPVSSLIAEGLALELMAEVAARPTDECVPPAWLRCAEELLREEGGNGTTVADVAAAVRTHPVYLARSFRKFYRCSPGEYLRYCRLQKAAGLLTKTHRPLSEIALDSGFADQSHFSKAFRQAYGSSPQKYRRQLLEN